MTEPAEPIKERRLAVIPLRAVANLMFGITGLATYYNRALVPALAPYRVPILILGISLAIFGLTEILVTLFSRKPARREHRNWTGFEVRLTREGMSFIAILITCFIGAFLGKANLLMLVFGFLAATFVINGSMTLEILKGNKARRRLPRSIMAGEPLAVELLLSNRRRWMSSWLMIVRDRVANSREVLFPQVLFSRVPPGREQSGWYQIRFSQRGLYQFGPLKILTRFPLGFVERSLWVTAPDQIIVHPRIGRLTSAWRQISAAAEDIMWNSRSRLGAHDDDFHRLREFRAGDNPRAIHWLTSARSNTLMVREYHETRDRDLMIMLDLAGTDTPETVDPSLELAISFAATLCVDHCRRNRSARLFLGIAGKETYFWHGVGGPNIVAPLLDQLAVARPVPTPNSLKVLETSHHLDWRGCRRILITTRKRVPGDPYRLAQDLGIGSQSQKPWQMISADPQELAPLFDWSW
ncbi:MAG: DUF58 domain-containing protein [Planctomycetales bacterium]